MRECKGTLKSLGCLAQHKQRWKRAMVAAYKYMRIDARNRQRVWKVMDKVSMNGWAWTVQEHV